MNGRISAKISSASGVNAPGAAGSGSSSNTIASRTSPRIRARPSMIACFDPLRTCIFICCLGNGAWTGPVTINFVADFFIGDVLQIGPCAQLGANAPPGCAELFRGGALWANGDIDLRPLRKGDADDLDPTL